MRKFSKPGLSLLFFLTLNVCSYAQVLKNFLQNQPEITRFKALTGKSDFYEVYEAMVKQPLDHSDTTKGFFQQRIIVSYLDTVNPTVVVTEGYSADYASRSSYREELSSILNTNQIVIEHRYFSKSKPDSLNWEYLTVANAAADDHDIIMIFKKLYKHKWISTGISKGGQTALYHRSLYPNDVDISVPYVAPLNVALEDGRHEPYINQISSNEDRLQIRDFQIEVLKRRVKLFPLFEKFVKNKKYSFRIPLEEVYDYCVLEYSFAFWQWGSSVADIPDSSASDEKVFNHFIKISSPDYFSLEGIEPIKAFLVQAAKEEGFYGYETEPFRNYLKISTAKGYFKRVFLEPGMNFRYNPETNEKVRDFLARQDLKMIFIYGEYDPWSATAVSFSGKRNMLKIVKPKGSHATRILNLPKHQRKMVMRKLHNWLNN